MRNVRTDRSLYGSRAGALYLLKRFSVPQTESVNLSTPNANYSDRTAPLTSKVAFYIFIQLIYVLNILNMVYTLTFFLFKTQFVS